MDIRDYDNDGSGDIEKITKNVEGWLTDDEGRLLYQISKKTKGRGVIVEIGSWKGKSTIWLGRGSKDGNNIKIYAIDPHTGSPEHVDMYGAVWTFEDFRRNIKIAGIEEVVIPIVKTSMEAANTFLEPIEFIFIDGNHDYESVKMDFELWYPKVIEGGFMAFHDTVIWDGPKKVVEKYVYKSRYFKDVGFVDSITFAQKAGRNSVKDVIKNRYILILKDIYEFSTRLHLPNTFKRIGKKILNLFQ